MVIDKIGNINNIIDTKGTKPVSKNKNIKQSDKVEISSEAKKAAELAKHTQMVKEAPDVRREIIEEIKTKMKDGTYDKHIDNKVLELVADKIASSLLRK